MPKTNKRKKIDQNKPVVNEGTLEQLNSEHEQILYEDRKKINKKFGRELINANKNKKSSGLRKHNFEEPKPKSKKEWKASDKYYSIDENDIEIIEDDLEFDKIEELEEKRATSYKLSNNQLQYEKVERLFQELNQYCELDTSFQNLVNAYSRILQSSKPKKEKISEYYNLTLDIFLENLETDDIEKSISVINKFENVMIGLNKLFVNKDNQSFPHYQFGGNKINDLKTKLESSIASAPTTKYEKNTKIFNEKHTQERIDSLNEKFNSIENANENELKDIVQYVKAAREIHDNRSFRWKFFNFIKNIKENNTIKKIEKELNKKIDPETQKQYFTESKEDHSVLQENMNKIDTFLKSKNEYINNYSLDLSLDNHKESIIVEDANDKIIEANEIAIDDNLRKEINAPKIN